MRLMVTVPPVKLIVTVTMVVMSVTLYLLAKNRAAEYRHEIEAYGFKLPFLASAGFYLAGKIPHSFNSNYELRVKSKILALFGERQSERYFAVHNAQKLTLVLAAINVMGLISLAGETGLSFIIMAILITAYLYYQTDRDLDKRLQQRKRDILIDLPEFINILALLVNAGLPVSGAVERIIRDANPEKPLNKELNCLLVDVVAGKPVSQAYEDFARRCRVPEVTRFVSTLLQNINRGGADLVYALRMMAQEAWEKRKDLARKQGEEAAAKLVLPMVMVFVAVAIIVIAPAVMTMSM